MAAAPKSAPNPLLNPNQQLQGPGLQQAAQALTDAQTTGPLTELAKQIAFNNKQGAAAQAKSAGYFKSLGNVAHLGAVGEQGIGSQLNSQLQGISQDTQNRVNQAGWQGLGSIVSHSPQGDQTGSNPAISGLAAEIARQQGLSAQNAGAYRAQGALQGANYSGLATQNQGTFALKGQEALRGMAQATRLANEPINQKIANLQASKGSLLASNEGKLRQQEISNQITQKGLNIKQDANTIAAQNNLANQNLAQQRVDATIRGQNVSLSLGQANQRLRAISNQIAGGNLTERQRHDLATEQQALNRGLGKTGGLSQTQANRYYAQIGQLQQLIKDGQAHGLNEQTLRGNLQDGQNPRKTAFDPALIDAAFALNGWGFLSSKQVSELNRLGLHPIGSGRYKQGTPPAGVLGGSLFGLHV